MLSSSHLGKKLTVAFTCTSLPLNLKTSVFRCGCGFGFEQFWWINEFGKEKKRIGGSAYSYSPLSCSKNSLKDFVQIKYVVHME